VILAAPAGIADKRSAGVGMAAGADDPQAREVSKRKRMPAIIDLTGLRDL
jgi:hypothetical protein